MKKKKNCPQAVGCRGLEQGGGLHYTSTSFYSTLILILLSKSGLYYKFYDYKYIGIYFLFKTFSL